MTGAPSNPANAHESVSDWFRNRRRADGMGNRIDRQRRLRQALIPNAARVSARQSVMSDTAFGADRKRVVQGKGVSGRVVLGGRRSIHKKTEKTSVTQRITNRLPK